MSVDDVHVPFAFTFANAAARQAEMVAISDADVGKLARQEDDGSYWLLGVEDYTLTWLPISGGRGVFVPMEGRVTMPIPSGRRKIDVG